MIRSFATLAHDCRRTDKLRPELFDLLRIVDRGDMTPAELRGDWLGKSGRLNSCPRPTSNLRWTSTAGKRDLIHSAPDALASTANYLKSYGWRRGEPWSEGPENFNVRLEWNKARVYPKTIAAFAERLAAGSR